MVDAVGDPYTVYQTPSQREISDTDLRGSFDGIGIQVDMKDNRLTVVAPIEGSPAEAAGFRPGDIVLEVDGKSLSGKTLSDTVGLIRGPRGTSSHPHRAAPGHHRPDRDHRRPRRDQAEVGSLPDAGRPGRVRPHQLVLGVHRRRDDERRQEPGGPAGEGASSSTCATTPAATSRPRSRRPPSSWTRAAWSSYQKSGNGDIKTYRTEGGGTASQVPLVVLINKGSASASEIMAGALRDNGRAFLVGEKSFGKGTVQNVHELSDKSGLRVTTAQWLTPAEKPIQGVGLLPDQVVELPPTSTISSEATRADDPQLDAAVRHLLGS